MTRITKLAAVLVTAACAGGGGLEPTPPPDTGRRVVAEHAAIATADPHASDAGLSILRAGGNAVDAAVAAAFAIGVVEPEMSGVGGGGAMTIWMQDARRGEYLDFYPAQNAATWRAAYAAGRISDDDSGDDGDLRVVGVPGNVAGLLAAHERFGRLSRAEVMAPAIRLAEAGFPVSQVLADFILDNRAKLSRFESSMRLMYPGGIPLAPGQRLRNPDLAATLRRISEEGPAGFYEGPVARAVVTAMNDGGNPVTAGDLAGYTARWKRPLCGYYRGRILLSAPPPQSGSQVLHTLELIEPHHLAELGLPTRSAAAFDILTGALRVGIADNRVNGDPNWQAVPAAGIVSEAFARERGVTVGATRVPDSIDTGDASAFDSEPATPQCAPFEPWAPSAEPDQAGEIDPGTDGGETTHISVVDEDGNAVALTQTNSTTFGSGANVGGFFLNDSGYEFTAESVNAPSRSSWITRRTTIAPTLVLHGGTIVAVIGAPGAGRIPTSIAQVLVYALDYDMDPLEAVRMPRIFPTPDARTVQIENGFSATMLEEVSSKGWQPSALTPGYARLYVIMRRNGRWIAVADPRHNGEARGY